MKKKTTFISTVLFVVFIGLFAYVWIANPNSTNIPIHTYPPYDGSSFHITFEKNVSSDMSGCRLIFFNQKMPFWGVRALPFSSDDKIKGKAGFMNYGMEFGSFIHSTSMADCSANDQTSETEFMGYGIFFYDLSHSVDKDKTWWTLMISLWYPIIIFGILPAIALIKKLLNRKSASTQKATVEKRDQ